MPAQSLQAIIGTALTDQDFRKALLNGSRRRVLQSFALTGDEVETIMSIRADSLEQFAGEVHRRLVIGGDDADLEPLPRPRTWDRSNRMPARV
jgi:hypothetical protein